MSTQIYYSLSKVQLITTLIITGGLLIFWLVAGFLLIRQRSHPQAASR